MTLALAQIVYYVFYKAERWTGGENGLRGIQVPELHVFGVTLDFLNPTTKYYVIYVFVAAALWIVSRILASPFGAVIEAAAEHLLRRHVTDLALQDAGPRLLGESLGGFGHTEVDQLHVA